jgi:nucleoside-diphosphate-sugar epimerase
MVEYLVSKMLAGETLYIGTPDSVRDYMFAEDHVSAYVAVARNPKAAGDVYNVSPGNPVTNSEVVHKIASMTGFNGKIVLGSYPPGYPQRPSSQDPVYLVLDSSKISRELGWKPKYSLDEGLRITVDMWKSEMKTK